MKDISLEEAKQIIKKFRSIYNRVTNYEKCYVFYYDDGLDEIKIGGVGSPMGVIKSTGEIISMPELVSDGFVSEDSIIESDIEVDLN